MPFGYAIWRLARVLHMDPETVRMKRRSVLEEWQLYAAADALHDDYRASETEAAMNRAMGG